jgi:hypothetical protein
MPLPTIVYRSPGPHAGEYGHTYESKGVSTQEALDEAHAAGWRDSVAEACAAAAGLLKAPSVEPADADDDAPPTRAELEEQAAKIGLKVDGRWSDKKLAERIIEAMDAATKPTEV